jgi:hypothetical protein
MAYRSNRANALGEFCLRLMGVHGAWHSSSWVKGGDLFDKAHSYIDPPEAGQNRVFQWIYV